MKKELARFFGDRRLVITTLLLPGIMIYVVYSFLGSAMNEFIKHIEIIFLADLVCFFNPHPAQITVFDRD